MELRHNAARNLENKLNGICLNQRLGPEGSHENAALDGSIENSSAGTALTNPSSSVKNYTINNSRTYDPSLKNSTNVPTSIQCGPESRWLLVCASARKRPISLSHMDVCSTPSDQELFQKMKDAYVNLRGRWCQILSLKTVKSIKFVQVSFVIRLIFNLL